MADNQEKKVGIEIHGPSILHGKRARLIRGENEVVGVILANDHQVNSKNLVFQFVDANGVKCISPISADEMQNIEESLLDY